MNVITILNTCMDRASEQCIFHTTPSWNTLVKLLTTIFAEVHDQLILLAPCRHHSGHPSNMPETCICTLAIITSKQYSDLIHIQRAAVNMILEQMKTLSEFVRLYQFGEPVHHKIVKSGKYFLHDQKLHWERYQLPSPYSNEGSKYYEFHINMNIQ